MGRLEGKRALITGAATGIGEAIAHKFASEGAKVFLTALPDDPIEKTAEKIKEKYGFAEFFKGNIADSKNAKECVETAQQKLGGIDILVNNAGTYQTVAETDKFPDDDFLYMTRMNTHSVFFMTKRALPYLQKSQGVVLSTGSEAGTLGQPKCTPYGASKGWIHGFMRGLALEQAQYGVRVNVVAPGPIDTEWHQTDVSPMTEKMEGDILSGTPMGRRGTVEEAANVFAFLASDEASFVTGAIYYVDGGISIGRGPIGDDVPDELKKPPKVNLDLVNSYHGLDNKETKSI